MMSHVPNGDSLSLGVLLGTNNSGGNVNRTLNGTYSATMGQIPRTTECISSYKLRLIKCSLGLLPTSHHCIDSKNYAISNDGQMLLLQVRTTSCCHSHGSHMIEHVFR